MSMASRSKGLERWMKKGEYAPVYVALGLVALSLTFGIYTAKQQLAHSPNVSVRKRRRETIPEVAQPDQVLNQAQHFIQHSFFRRIAHLQHSPHHPPPVKAETLKDVGVDPILPPPYPHHHHH